MERNCEVRIRGIHVSWDHAELRSHVEGRRSSGQGAEPAVDILCYGPQCSSPVLCIRIAVPLNEAVLGRTAHAQKNIYKQGLVDKQSCTLGFPDNMAVDLRERLPKFRDEIGPLQYFFLLNGQYPPNLTSTQRRGFKGEGY